MKMVTIRFPFSSSNEKGGAGLATKEEILDKLNSEQQQAVIDYEGSMAIAAGPGAGKTRTIVARCQYMILDGVRPGSILAFTFTRKAANELRERIQDAVGEHAAKEMMIATYHSFCGKLLRKFAASVGRTRNFTIYDDDDKRGVLDPICKKYHNYKYVQACEYISQFKDNGITADQAVQNQYQDSYKAVAARIYKEYETVMAKCNAFDFDDLTFYAYLLLLHDKKALDYVHRQFKYILADEFQDSNWQNIQFMLMLRGDENNLCVVMDDDQSIYGFRGARSDKVLETVQRPEFKLVHLNTNYRSTQMIVKASCDLIQHNLVRVDKELRTSNENGNPITIIHAKSDTYEAQNIALRIRNLHEIDHIAYEDMAVLCRVQRSTRALEEVFLKMNPSIPYQLKGIAPFYARREVKDMIAYLRLLLNPQDVEAFRRVVNIPKHNVGATTIEKILTKARQNEDTYDIITVYRDLSFAFKTKLGLEEFERNFISIRNYAASHKNLHDVIQFIVHTVRYQSYLESEYDASGVVNERMGNLDELAAIASQFTEIEDFMQNFVVDPDPATAEGLKEGEKTDAVSIMTMHSSKGLEFKVVFLFEANEGIIPHQLNLSTPQEIEEERRLFYVAMTRAKEELYISYSDVRKQSNYKPVYSEPSRFIKEIPAIYIKEEAV